MELKSRNAGETRDSLDELTELAATADDGVQKLNWRPRPTTGCRS
jgi:hypothetical protein